MLLPYGSSQGPTRLFCALTSSCPSRGKKEGGLVFVGLLDGKLAALDKASGATRWTFDSGVPLVSSSADAGPNSPAALRIFPGTDGSLYTYGGNGGKHGIQVLHVLREGS